MLSGLPNDLLLTHSFHGTIISWARQAQKFHQKAATQSVQEVGSSDVEATWKTWAQEEETIRVVLGLYVHDSEFTTIFHTDPFLRPEHARLPRCCSDEIFNAPTAASWKTLMDHNITERTEESARSGARRESSVRRLLYSSQLHSYVALSTIISSLCEAHNSPINHTPVQKFCEQLQAWWQTYYVNIADMKEDPYYLSALWHEAFLMLYANVDMLERAIGRDGIGAARDGFDDVLAWATASVAQRCVLHAALALWNVERRSFMVEPAIHVPKTMFHAGIVIYSYVKFSRDPVEASDIRPGEFSCLPGLSSVNACWNLLQSIDFSTLSGVIGVLRRIGHWGISRKYASILEALADELAAFPPPTNG